MAFTYIVKCRDNSLYTGSTKNLYERVIKHNLKKGAKYTRGRCPVVLVYFEEFENYNDALARESKIKKLTKKEKNLLINQIKYCPISF
ncbi:MAG TPA: GIY-YIG nuclease family protein [Spirochaetota bacterium]|nr:GIY-YIG nuclease family protein [Spirochaetota bacterium]